jgi:hypothetical protein
MGAYENPRLINAPNYAAGFENFDKKFQAGLKEGFAEGQRKIEADKNYVSSVEERADAMRKKGEAAIANSQKTREQLEGELDKFYKKALEIEPGGKGIGGLFTGGRKMLGDMDLKRLENDFSDKMAPINAMYNKIYDPEWDFGKHVDKNSDDYEDLKLIKNAVEAGRIDTGIKFIEGDKDKNIPMGWDSGLKIFDDAGNVEKEYSAAELSRIMGTDTKEMRASIDARNDEINTRTVSKTSAAVANKESDLKVDESIAPGSTKAEVLRPEDHLHGSIAEQIKTDSFYIKNDQGVYETIQPNADGTYAAVVDEDSELAGLFANHGIKYLKTNSQDAIDMLKRTVPSIANIDDSKLKLILNSNMNMGTEKIKSILGDDFNKVFKNFQANKTLLKNAGVPEGYEESVLELEGKTPAEVIKSIHDGQAITKAAIYHESVKKDVMDRGLLNKAYVPPAKKEVDNKMTDAERKELAIYDYSRKRTEQISKITATSMETIENPMDYTGSVQGGGSEPVGLDPTLPIGTTVRPGVKVFANPEYDQKKADKLGDEYDVPKTVYGLKGSEEMRNNFIGKVLKVGDKGQLHRIKDVFISPEGDITFDHEDGYVTETQGNEKSQVDIIASSTPYNIYNPLSMKSMYKAMLSDLKSENATVLGDNAYEALISNSYLNNPAQFVSGKMDKWAGYIKKEFGLKKMYAHPQFMDWFWKKKQGAKLSEKHPWKPLYNALVDQELSNS